MIKKELQYFKEFKEYVKLNTFEIIKQNAVPGYKERKRNRNDETVYQKKIKKTEDKEIRTSEKGMKNTDLP